MSMTSLTSFFKPTGDRAKTSPASEAIKSASQETAKRSLNDLGIDTADKPTAKAIKLDTVTPVQPKEDTPAVPRTLSFGEIAPESSAALFTGELETTESESATRDPENGVELSTQRALTYSPKTSVSRTADESMIQMVACTTDPDHEKTAVPLATVGECATPMADLSEHKEPVAVTSVEDNTASTDSDNTKVLIEPTLLVAETSIASAGGQLDSGTGSALVVNPGAVATALMKSSVHTTIGGTPLIQANPSMSAADVVATAKVEMPPEPEEPLPVTDWSRHESFEWHEGVLQTSSNQIGRSKFTYYFNHVTGESTIDRPTDYAVWQTKYDKVMAKRRKNKPKNAAQLEADRLKLLKMGAAAEREVLRLQLIQQKEVNRIIKEEERAKLKAEKEKLKREEDDRKAAEKEAKAKLKLEEDARKAEEKAAEKAAREAAREAERAAKEAASAAEKALRQQQREIERKQKEEAAEKEKMKKKGVTKGAQAMFSMFVKKVSKPVPEPEPEGPKSFWDRFHTPDDTTLAPIARAAIATIEAASTCDSSFGIDAHLESLHASWLDRQRKSRKEIAAKESAAKATRHNTSSSSNTLSISADPDITIVEDETRVRRRMKLLQFAEDVRPPWYGTFSKISSDVSGRTPFKKAEQECGMDYDWDSEAEWEEGEQEEGEDCDSSDDKDKEDEEEGEADEDDWMVPHGYLSDDEGINDEASHELTEVEREAKRQLKRSMGGDSGGGDAAHKPRKRVVATSYGCVWGEEAAQHKVLRKYAMELLISTPIDVYEKTEARKFTVGPLTPTKADADDSEVNLKSTIPDTLMPELITLLHGSKESTEKIVSEFVAKHPGRVTKAAVKRIVEDKTINVKEVRAPYKKAMRFVVPRVLAQYKLSALKLPTPGASNSTISGVKSIKSSMFEVLKKKPQSAWVKHMDKETGVPYYYNQLTKESSWIPPSDM